MSFYTILTELGQAKLTQAVGLGVAVDLTQMALGDGGGEVVAPAESTTALVGEVYRAGINSLMIDPENPNWLIAEMVVPTDQGGWAVREVGVFDAAGSLFAVGNFPETYKPQLAEGSGRELTVRIYIEVSNAAAVTLKVDPTVTFATRTFVQQTMDQHVGANDPHAQYEKKSALGGAAYKALGDFEAAGVVGRHEEAVNPHSQYALAGSLGSAAGKGEGEGSGLDSDLWRGLTPAQLLAQAGATMLFDGEMAASGGDSVNGYDFYNVLGPEDGDGLYIFQFSRVTSGKDQFATCFLLIGWGSLPPASDFWGVHGPAPGSDSVRLYLDDTKSPGYILQEWRSYNTLRRILRIS